MSGVKISLRPLQEARWETHEPTGAQFLVAALPSDKDQELAVEATDFAGNLDPVRFCQLVAAHCVKDWRGVGDATGPVPCNAENVKVFVQHHALGIGAWLIRRARSLEHYRAAEVDAAKKG